MREPLVSILERDPELGEGLDASRLALASRHVVAPTITLERGNWDAERLPERVRAGLGLLVLGGRLLRRVGLAGRDGSELLAAGDLLRPWQHERLVASVPPSAHWIVLERAQLALLDVDFGQRIAAYPEIHAQLLGRALRRSRHLAVHMAIVHQPRVETRVRLLLWYFADRWGTVRPDGVHVPLPLTHAIFAELLAASRPTVSAAVNALQRDGQLSRVGGGWLLHGSPPGEVREPPIG